MNTEQPKPIQNDSQAIWPLVICDMQSRDDLGRQRYGTPLQANNGRDMLVDAYEEALDLVVYLRAAIAERDTRAARIAVLEQEAELYHHLRDEFAKTSADAKGEFARLEPLTGEQFDAAVRASMNAAR